MVVSTVLVRNMRYVLYVVDRDRQAVTGKLIITIIYLFDNFLWKIFPRHFGLG
jgi:hypothetical protein